MLSILNELTIFYLVVVCWWLVHANASGPEPFRMTISVCYALAAMCKACAGFFEFVPAMAETVPVFKVVGRFFLELALTFVALRLMHLYPDKPAP